MGTAEVKEINCAFCSGKGIDPFGILSELSLCQVCGGAKEVRVREPLRKCVFCGGAGVHPHTRLTCTVCMGKGVVTFQDPIEECPKCQGAGASVYLNLPCTLCGGKGVITVRGGNYVGKRH